ncbi:MAG: hypothetical protein IPI43_32330 [Sandaracinaceae bacterium]|nr:hypothetical protein [Sandaracinaceae bacterium]
MLQLAERRVVAAVPTLRLRTALLRVAEARQREAERDARGTGALGVYVERDSPRDIVVAGVAQFTSAWWTVADQRGPRRPRRWPAPRQRSSAPATSRTPSSTPPSTR